MCLVQRLEVVPSAVGARPMSPAPGLDAGGPRYGESVAALGGPAAINHLVGGGRCLVAAASGQVFYRLRRAIAKTDPAASTLRPRNSSKARARSGDSRHVPLR